MSRRPESAKRKLHMLGHLFSLALTVCLIGYVGDAAPTVAASGQAQAELTGGLELDSPPPGIVPSSQYTVRLSQNDSWISSFVYQVQNPGFLPNGQPSGISSSSTSEHASRGRRFPSPVP